MLPESQVNGRKSLSVFQLFVASLALGPLRASADVCPNKKKSMSIQSIIWQTELLLLFPFLETIGLLKRHQFKFESIFTMRPAYIKCYSIYTCSLLIALSVWRMCVMSNLVLLESTVHIWWCLLCYVLLKNMRYTLGGCGLLVYIWRLSMVFSLALLESIFHICWCVVLLMAGVILCSELHQMVKRRVHDDHHIRDTLALMKKAVELK